MLLLGCTLPLKAQTGKPVLETRLADTLSLGFQMDVDARTSSYSISGVNASAFDKSPYIDIGKALYGKIAGLNVTQGTGSSADNVTSFTLHGHKPLVLVDGFPRDISDVTSSEIESVQVLKDAAASAIYGMRGANGVILITTKRGANEPLNVKVEYNYGLNTQFRTPEFADAYTYANSINTALANDGMTARYSELELEAFRNGTYPYDYPNVDWWKETMNDIGYSHNLKFTFSGGKERFRYFTAVDYYRDRSMLKKNTEDDRFDTTPTDTRLSIRTNLDVQLTNSTYMKAGIVGKLQETRGTRWGSSAIFNQIYNTPSAAFPIRYKNGVYGGSTVYGANNPVALLKDYGHRRDVFGTLMADMSLRQKLDGLTQGLAAEVSVSFDNIGSMYETSSKSYRYMNSNAQITEDGTLVTTPQMYGTDSETLGHSQPFRGLSLRNDMQAKIDYSRTFGKHQVDGALVYDMQSVVNNGRNNTHKNQSVMVNASYVYDNRYALNTVFTYAGSAYLPDGNKFDSYPAVSAAWIVSNEKFMEDIQFVDLLKVRASYGLSGWDGNLSHELWRQAYGSGNSYYFGSNVTQNSGGAEGSLPVIGLLAEKSEKTTIGLDFAGFNNRLTIALDGFYEKRSDVLVSGSTSTSGIVGITVGQVNEGIYEYKGFDASLGWSDKIDRKSTRLNSSHAT